MDLLNRLHDFTADAKENAVLWQALFGLSEGLAPIISGNVLIPWQPVTF
jgi:hypothetical protein